MEIISVADKRFKKYGKVIKNIDFSSLVEEMKKTEIPEGTQALNNQKRGKDTCTYGGRNCGERNT